MIATDTTSNRVVHFLVQLAHSKNFNTHANCIIASLTKQVNKKLNWLLWTVQCTYLYLRYWLLTEDSGPDLLILFFSFFKGLYIIGTHSRKWHIKLCLMVFGQKYGNRRQYTCTCTAIPFPPNKPIIAQNRAVNVYMIPSSIQHTTNILHCWGTFSTVLFSLLLLRICFGSDISGSMEGGKKSPNRCFGLDGTQSGKVNHDTQWYRHTIVWLNYFVLGTSGI